MTLKTLRLSCNFLMILKTGGTLVVIGSQIPLHPHCDAAKYLEFALGISQQTSVEVEYISSIL